MLYVEFMFITIYINVFVCGRVLYLVVGIYFMIIFTMQGHNYLTNLCVKKKFYHLGLHLTDNHRNK